MDEADRTAPITDRLPPGMRVDGCLLGRLKVAFGTGDPTPVEIACDLAAGCEVSPNAGENLAAWLVEGPGIVGNFAIRDIEWLERAHALEFVSFAEAKAGQTTRFRAETAGVRTFEFAAAWTSNPSDDAEDVAPWYAVDRVMTHRT